MTITPLLRTKLNRPRLTRPVIRRVALFERLNRGLAGDVTLVSAPAGYGKTTLIAEWANQAPLPVAWLGLDEADNELGAFLTYLIAAIRTLQADACPTTLGLAKRDKPTPVDVLATMLVNEIDDLPQRFALVLDDFQVITLPDILVLLDKLLHRPPTQMHLVLLSRAAPPLTLSRLRAKGMLNELQVEDLRFSPPEAKAFLAEDAGFLDEQVAATVLERAEGWVAGLHLAALSLHQAPDLPEMVSFLTKRSDAFVIDYLFDQVLRRQEPEVQDFLIKTSILSRFTPSLARAVAGASEMVPTTLVEVAAAGLFLNALDNRGEWFTYHVLFREALQKALRETLTPDEIAGLHLRAAGWFIGHGLVEEALDHALAGGDSSLAARIVADSLADLLNVEGRPILERRLARLPAQDIERHPLLLMGKTYVLTYQLHWDAILPVIRRAEALVADWPATLSPEDKAPAEALLHWNWAYHWLFELEPEKTRAAAESALLLLPAGYAVPAATILHVLSVARQWLGEFEQAERTLNAALVAQSAGAPQPQVTLALLFAQTTLYIAEGHLIHGRQIAQMLLQMARQTGAENVEAWACLQLGAAAYFANDLAQAIEYFSQGVGLRYGSNILACEQCLAGLALAYRALGQGEEVGGVLAIMRDFHSQKVNPMLNLEYRSLEARLALMNGDIQLARQWGSDTPSDDGLVFGWFVVPSITNIRIRLADNPPPGELDQIEAELDRLLGRLVRLRQPTRQIELLALKAVVADERGDSYKAQQVLEEALALAEPRGVIRPVLDAGPQLVPTLQAINRQRPTPYVARLLDALQTPRPLAGTKANKAPYLTPREREVLTLLGQYQTDRVIAETLVVSPLTVRSHIENLAEKLGVRGRRRIVDRARELALIP